MNTREEIAAFKPAHEFFVGIDSDGTVFDSMNIKHIKAFLPAALETWGFGKGREEFEKIWKRLNLYSTSRGINRFTGLLHALEQLQNFNINVFSGDIAPLRDFVENSEALSNAALRSWMQEHPGPLLNDVMHWSIRGDELFEEHTRGLLPFTNVEPALKVMAEQADIMVVSSALGKSLDKDWSFAGLSCYVTLLAGQEAGNKKDQLRMAVTGKYPSHKILMIGDSPGDMEAVRSINALFFPVMPGREEESWIRFREESLPRFFAGTYRGKFEDMLIRDFFDFLS